MSSASRALLRTLPEKTDSRHNALLVIDVQNDIVAAGDFFDQVGVDVRILQVQRVPSLLSLIDKARRTGTLRETQLSWNTWVTPTSANNPLGWMPPEDRASTVSVLKAYGAVTTPLDAAQLYTNDFVPEGKEFIPLQCG